MMFCVPRIARSSARPFLVAVLLLGAPSLLVVSAKPALAQSQGAPTAESWTGMSDGEFASMACLVGGTAAGAATVLIGSVALVATGTMTSVVEAAVAVPVIVGTASAGCAMGAAVAPALSWMRRQGARIVSDIKVPEISVPPESPKANQP